MKHPLSQSRPNRRMGILGQCFGRMSMTVRGSRLYPFLNQMQKQNIRCYGQQLKGEILSGIIYEKDKKRLQRLANVHHMTLELHSHPTIYAFLRRFRLRLGWIFGGMLAAVLLMYCCNVVMRIEVQGCQTVSETEVLQLLEECGVRRGTFIGKISFAQCEHHLRAAIPEVCRVAIRHTGNRMVIEITEAEEEVPMVRKRIPCNLIATQDAEICSVSVQRGQLMRLVGDTVRRGTLLVSGIQQDAQGHIRFLHAMAEIQGTYTVTQTFVCPYVQTLSTLSGKESTQTYLDFFTLPLPLSHKETPYAHYQTLEERLPLTLFGKTLPIAICRNIQQEQVETILQYTPEEAKQQLREQQKRYEDNFLQGTTFDCTKSLFRKKETVMELTVSYQVTGNIAEEQLLFAKK